MRTLRKSEIQKKEDHALLMKIMRDSGYACYSDRLNPFNCLTQKTRFDRFKRKYERYLSDERGNEDWFNDICEVYGTVL